MHHKKRRPSSTRAACKLCRPWKKNRHAAAKCRTRWQEVERIEIEEQIRSRLGG